MPRPRIGISMDTGQPDDWRKVLTLNANYAEMVYRAGGMPVLLPHTHEENLRREMLENLDALLIPGGDDVDPRTYSQSKHPRTRLMDPLRQDFDLALLRLAEEQDIPTLGICLGFQLMNVHRGGTLHQRLEEAFPDSPVGHARVTNPENYHSAFHEVMLRPGTHLGAIFGHDNLMVNSRHRQGVDQLGQGLIPAAFANDGLLEGLEDYTKRFWVGVQWHPEDMLGTEQDKLFKALVAAAETYRLRKTYNASA